jgi:4-hydroxybenzoate polyprenyltransferase
MRRMKHFTTPPIALPSESSRAIGLFRALRPQQWVKNVLIFVPLILSHRIRDSHSLLLALFAFADFSLCASAVYLLNDLLDLEADRLHPTKKNRPIAAGKVSIPTALIAALILLVASLGLAFFSANRHLVQLLALYFLISSAYSFFLKRVAMLDVVTLAGLYTLRIFFGAVATGITISTWLLAFSVFFFMSLAMVKRFSALARLPADNPGPLSGRAYTRSDMPMIASLGSASGFVSVLVMALYINSQDVLALYARPQLLWLMCPLLLYWVSRLWLLAHRGDLNEDPIVFAVYDEISYLIGILVIAIIWLASREGHPFLGL